MAFPKKTPTQPTQGNQQAQFPNQGGLAGSPSDVAQLYHQNSPQQAMAQPVFQNQQAQPAQDYQARLQDLQQTVQALQQENLLLQEAPFRDTLLTLLSKIDAHLVNLVRQSEYQSRLLYDMSKAEQGEDDGEDDADAGEE